MPESRLEAVLETLHRLLAGAGVTVAGDAPAGFADRFPPGSDVLLLVRGRGGGRGEADVVIDWSRPDWPVIRHVDERLPYATADRLRETQAFFAVRAAGWDATFGDDLPAYAAAVAETGIRPDAVVADVGCGTGRALPFLRAAAGRVLAVDVTAQMLAALRQQGRDQGVALLLADAERLPLAAATLDVIFAAGLLPHTQDAAGLLRELGRVTRPGGRLTLFHPTGRAALAARHGRTLDEREPLSAGRLPGLLAQSGWQLERYDDAAHRFFALARRER